MFTFLLCIYLIRSVFVSRFVLVLCIRAFLLYYFSSFFVAWTRNGIRLRRLLVLLQSVEEWGQKRREEIRREAFKIARREEWSTQGSSRQIIAGFSRFWSYSRGCRKMFCFARKKKKKIKEKRKKEMKRNYRLIKRIKRTIIRGRIICHALFIKKCANERKIRISIKTRI